MSTSWRSSAKRCASSVRPGPAERLDVLGLNVGAFLLRRVAGEADLEGIWGFVDGVTWNPWDYGCCYFWSRFSSLDKS